MERLWGNASKNTVASLKNGAAEKNCNNGKIVSFAAGGGVRKKGISHYSRHKYETLYSLLI